MGLALGARADTAAIRRGAGQASVAASFDLPKSHPAHVILSEQGLDDDDVLTLRRTISSDGRGRAFVNDQPASVARLRRLGDSLVEIQGQMEQHGLLDMATPAPRSTPLPGWRNRRPRRRGATRISCATP